MSTAACLACASKEDFGDACQTFCLGFFVAKTGVELADIHLCDECQRTMGDIGLGALGAIAEQMKSAVKPA